LTPPLPERAERVATVVSMALAEAPRVPTPAPALRRRAVAVMSFPSEAESRMLPVTAEIATFPVVLTSPPRLTLFCA